ncbi:DUF6431 domain-containing protein [Planococcus antarcticus]|nr:DUF6431 domain-containing protein [Planococcus antarcticus]
MIIVNDYFIIIDALTGVFLHVQNESLAPPYLHVVRWITKCRITKTEVVHGSWRRTTYVIRYLRCTCGQKLLHELQDSMIPYKRYEAKATELM